MERKLIEKSKKHVTVTDRPTRFWRGTLVHCTVVPHPHISYLTSHHVQHPWTPVHCEYLRLEPSTAVTVTVLASIDRDLHPESRG
jgi:hypothetical protein